MVYVDNDSASDARSTATERSRVELGSDGEEPLCDRIASVGALQHVPDDSATHLAAGGVAVILTVSTAISPSSAGVLDVPTVLA